MPRYDDLQTTAFRVKVDAFHAVNGRFRMLPFPRTWLAPIVDLMQSANIRRRTIPISSLNRAVRALVPDVSAIDRGVGLRDHPGDWLYGAEPSAIDGLTPIVHAWLRTVVGGERADQATALWARLPKDDFVWQQLDPGGMFPSDELGVLPDTPEATNRIASLPPSSFYLVPEILISELLHRTDRPPEFPSGFRRSPTQDGRGVEMISWPPHELTDRDGRWPYSFRVRVTLQTVPYQPDPLIHVTIGIRRWCPRAPFPGRRSVNAYMYSKVPWISGISQSRSFRTAPMRWSRTADRVGLNWRRELHHLFDNLAFDSVIIDPARLAEDPMAYIDSDEPDVAAALVYNTQAGYPHHVGTGVSARDRHRIRGWVEETLADIIEPVPGLAQVPVTLPKLDRPTTEEVRQRVREALSGRPLTVEILWDSEDVRDAVTQAVLNDLGCDHDGGTETDQGTVYTANEQHVVTVVQRPIGALAAPLTMDNSIKNIQLRKRRAAQPRIDEIKESLGRVDTTLTFVELRDRDAFPVSGTDPKAALRIGFAESGRLTQFVTPAPRMPDDSRKRMKAEKETSERCAASWRDLRRQLVGSVRPVRSRVKKLNLPHPADSIAIYMLRRNATDHSWAHRHQLPVATWTSTDSADVWATTIGDTGWLPYSAFLQELAGRAFKFPEITDQRVCGFVRNVIASARRDRPTLLMTWTQNLRVDWKDLQNSNAVIDRLTVAGDPLDGISRQVRHVMIRTRDHDETPEVYGKNEARVGLPSGLFRYPNSSRVFASIGRKPSSARRHSGPMHTRVDDVMDDEGRSLLDPRRPSFNPQCLELTVAMQPEGDDATVWAAMAHSQRRLADTYADDLRLPWPLHLAMKATEYAIPDVDDDVTEDVDPDEASTLEDEAEPH